MHEKMKKQLLSLAVRTVVSVGIFAVIFIICKIFPDVLKAIRPAWKKSMDIQKIGSLLKDALKEALP